MILNWVNPFPYSELQSMPQNQSGTKFPQTQNKQRFTLSKTFTPSYGIVSGFFWFEPKLAESIVMSLLG